MVTTYFKPPKTKDEEKNLKAANGSIGRCCQMPLSPFPPMPMTTHTEALMFRQLATLWKTVWGKKNLDKGY